MQLSGPVTVQVFLFGILRSNHGGIHTSSSNWWSNASRVFDDLLCGRFSRALYCLITSPAHASVLASANYRSEGLCGDHLPCAASWSICRHLGHRCGYSNRSPTGRVHHTWTPFYTRLQCHTGSRADACLYGWKCSSECSRLLGVQ